MLPINCPFNSVKNTNSDGLMQMLVKAGANYEPQTQHEVANYFNGLPDPAFKESPVELPKEAKTAERLDWKPNSDTEQATILWRKVFSDADREQTVLNFASALKVVRKSTFDRFVALLATVDEELAKRVKETTDALPMNHALRH